MVASSFLRLALVSLLVAGCSSDTGRTPAAPDAPGSQPAPPDGPAPVAPFAMDQPGISEMAVDATHLYWVENGQFDHEANVRRISLDGGSIETLLSKPERMYSLAVADGFVYAVQTSGGAANYEGHVYRVAVTGGPVTELATAFNPTSVAVDGNWVYYSEAISPDGRILRVPTTGGTPEVVASDVDNPWDLEADDGVVFYSEMNRGRMMRVVPGGAPVVLASGWTATNWMAIDDADVYFGTFTEGSFLTPMFRVPRDGGTVQQVILGPSHNDKIAVSRNNVQWGAQVVSKIGGGVHDAQNIAHKDGLAVAVTDGAMYFADFFTGAIFRVGL